MLRLPHTLIACVLALCFACIAVASIAAPVEEEQSIVRSFDPTQLTGTWYEIARLDHADEHGLEQVTIHYSLETDGSLQIMRRGYNPDENKWNEVIGKAGFTEPPNTDGSRTGHLTIMLPGSPEQNYLILEIDKPYYNYSLVSSNLDSLWILSRTPQLTYPIKQHLIAKAKELGFATDQLLFIRQANQVEYESGRHVMPEHH
jgi:apolipoprotein D and lipocalin family protein